MHAWRPEPDRAILNPNPTLTLQASGKIETRSKIRIKIENAPREHVQFPPYEYVRNSIEMSVTELTKRRRPSSKVEPPKPPAGMISIHFVFQTDRPMRRLLPVKPTSGQEAGRGEMPARKRSNFLMAARLKFSVSLMGIQSSPPGLPAPKGKGR